MVQSTGNSSESTPVNVDNQSSIESNDSSEPPDSQMISVGTENQLKYLDFEVEIREGKRHQYPVTVLNSPGGEATATISWPFTHASLADQLAKIDDILLRASARRRRRLDPSEKTIQDFGANLFDALIAGELRSLYDVSREKAFQQGRGLRIKLRINEPKLATLPWEYMYDRRQDQYVGLSNRTPIVRYLETPQPRRPLITTKPLRILGLAANPKDGAPINSNNEKRRVETALKHLIERGLIELKWVEGSTWRDLQRELLQGPWHIFHFIGHGYFDDVQDEGFIVLSDEDGNGDRLSATRLGLLLADHQPLRLVLLNACDGAKASVRDTLSSSASILVKQGIPAVLAMQNEISNKAAVECARSFYQSIAYGSPVDAAAADARKGISLEDRNSPEWGTPVLYMRSPDGLLLQTPYQTQSKEYTSTSMATTALSPLTTDDSVQSAVIDGYQLAAIAESGECNNPSVDELISQAPPPNAETSTVRYYDEPVTEFAIEKSNRSSSAAITVKPSFSAEVFALSVEKAQSWWRRLDAHTIRIRHLLTLMLGLGLFTAIRYLFDYYYTNRNTNDSIPVHEVGLGDWQAPWDLALSAPVAWAAFGVLVLYLMRPTLSTGGKQIIAGPLIWTGIWSVSWLLNPPWSTNVSILESPQTISAFYVAIGLIAAAVSQSQSYALVSSLFTLSRHLRDSFLALLTLLGSWFALEQLTPLLVQVSVQSLSAPAAPLPNAPVYSMANMTAPTDIELFLSATAWASQWASIALIAYVALAIPWTIKGQLAPLLMIVASVMWSIVVGFSAVAIDPFWPMGFQSVAAGLMAGLLFVWIWSFEGRSLYHQVGAGNPEAASHALTLLQARHELNEENAGEQLHWRNLRNLNLSNLPLTGVSFEGASLAGANLDGSQMQNCNLQFTVLRSGSLIKANLAGADLRYANLEGADLDGVDLSYALYNSQTVWPDGFDHRRSGAIGPRAQLKQSDLRWMNFAGMELTGINFKEADLAFSNFAGADLSKASFRSANLAGADLRDVQYKNATFREALYDERTRWPDGFDPEKRGAILIS